MPIGCFLEGKQDRSFSNWLEVVHSGNIKTFIQPALDLKYFKAEANLFSNYIYNLGNFVDEHRYVKGEVGQFISQASSNLAPINNPTFTGTVSVNGTLTCLQLNPNPRRN